MLTLCQKVAPPSVLLAPSQQPHSTEMLLERKSLKLSRLVDSGLVVVVCITASMIAIVVYCLVFVKYEWCHVLFKNNTVGRYCLLVVP